MVLERLQLRNFRGFEELDLTFEPDLTVLVGVNGCGKTSIIDALLIGLGLQPLLLKDFRIGTDSTTIRASTSEHQDVSITGTRRYDGTGEPHHEGMLLSLSGPNLPAPSILALVYGVDRGATDQTPGPTAPRDWKPSEAALTSLDRVDYQDFFYWLREMEDDENERIRYDEGSENLLLRSVREAIYQLFPGYADLRIRRSGAMGDSRPRLTVKKNGTSLLFDSLGEGERSSVALIADIARRLIIANPQSDAPLAAPFLLLIDEFEQHLHPQWQRELPSRMAKVFPGAQMLLTTHSPIVVSDLLPRQLRPLQDFRLLDGAHREGQDVNEILETLFSTASRKPKTQALIDAIDDALDEDALDAAATKLDTLEQQLGTDDPEVVRLRTLQRMLGAQDHDAVSEG